MSEEARREPWRLDSLDARAGYAFASCRPADLFTDELRLDRAAVFLSPPAFSPEALGSRTIGFSAARGRAQLGVFLDGAELAFGSLEDLIEFVRRLYISSGGGDATGGGGPRPPAPPSEGGPSPGRGEERTEGDDWRRRSPTGGAQAVVDVAVNALKLANDLDLEHGSPLKTSDFQAESKAPLKNSFSDGEALANGAAELVTEFLRRYPSGGRFPSPYQQDRLIQWYEGAKRLGSAISRLGLWQLILSGPFGSSLDETGRQIASQLDVDSSFSSRLHSRYLIPLLLEDLPMTWPCPWHDVDYFCRYGPHAVLRSMVTLLGDPLDDLASWLLPSDIARQVGLTSNEATAFHLINVATATPAKLAGDGILDVRAAEVLLFSVAHILSASETPLTVAWYAENVHATALASMITRCFEWLSRQWPRRVFPRQVEDLIGEAAALSSA